MESSEIFFEGYWTNLTELGNTTIFQVLKTYNASLYAQNIEIKGNIDLGLFRK